MPIKYKKKRKTVRGKTMRKKTMRGKTVRGKTVRGKTMRGKTVRGKTVRGKTHRTKRNIFAGDPRRSSIRRSSASNGNPFDAKVDELKRDIHDMFKYNRYGESLYMNDLNLLLMIKSEREVDKELADAFSLKIKVATGEKSILDIFNELITAMRSDPRADQLSYSEVSEIQDTIDNEFLNQGILLTDNGPELNPYPRLYMVKYIIDLIEYLLKRGEGTPKPDLEMYIHEWLSQFKIDIIDMAIQYMIDYNRDLRKIIQLLKDNISDREKIIRRSQLIPTHEIIEFNRIKTYYRNILTVKRLLENLNEKISMLSGATSQDTSKIMDKFFKRDGILFTPEEIALDICNNIANIIEYGILLVYRYNSPALRNIYTEKDLIDTNKDKLNNILNIMSILKTVIYSTYFPFSDEDCEKIFNKFYR